MAIKQFAFWKQKYSARSGYYYAIIKQGKTQVGMIRPIEGGWYQVFLSIVKEPTEMDPVPFQWVRLKGLYKTLEEGIQAFTGPSIYEYVVSTKDLYPLPL